MKSKNKIKNMYIKKKKLTDCVTNEKKKPLT